MVLVGIDEDPESLEFVCVAENRAWRSTLLSDPYGHAIAVEVPYAMDFEFDFNLSEDEPTG